jgi:hypothetical protein
VKRVNLYAAEGFRDDDSPLSVAIVIDRTVPGNRSTEQMRALYASEGAALADALWSSLPGGTVDALMAALFARRASLFRVTFDRGKP